MKSKLHLLFNNDYKVLTSHLGLLIAVAIWASTFVGTKVAMQQIPPNTLAFLRFFIASAVLVPIFLLTNQPKIHRKDWLRTAFCGLAGITMYNFLQNQGLKFTSPTDAAILASMAPVFMAILGWLVLQEKINASQALCILMAFAGSVLVATNGFISINLDSTRLWGDFLILLTGLAWALYNIGLKPLLGRYSTVTILTCTAVAGTVFLFPAMLLESPNFSKVSIWGWLNVLYLGLMASTLAYFLWNMALKNVSTFTAGVYLYFLPLIAAFISLIVFREIPGVFVIIGGLIILTSTYLINKFG